MTRIIAASGAQPLREAIFQNGMSFPLLSILSFVVGCNAPSDPVVNSAAPSALSPGAKPADSTPQPSLAQLAAEVHATDFQVVDTVGPGHGACAEPEAKHVTLSSSAQTWLAAVLERLAHPGAPELDQVRLNVPQARLQQRLREAAPNYHNAVSQGREAFAAYSLASAGAGSETLCLFFSTSESGAQLNRVYLGVSQSWSCNGLPCRFEE